MLNWIRWIIALPVAIVVSRIVILVCNFFLGEYSWASIVSDAIVGTILLVFVLYKMVPKYKVNVSLMVCALSATYDAICILTLFFFGQYLPSISHSLSASQIRIIPLLSLITTIGICVVLYEEKKHKVITNFEQCVLNWERVKNFLNKPFGGNFVRIGTNKWLVALGIGALLSVLFVLAYWVDNKQAMMFCGYLLTVIGIAVTIVADPRLLILYCIVAPVTLPETFGDHPVFWLSLIIIDFQFLLQLTKKKCCKIEKLN